MYDETFNSYIKDQIRDKNYDNIYEIPHSESVKPVKIALNSGDVLVVYVDINTYDIPIVQNILNSIVNSVPPYVKVIGVPAPGVELDKKTKEEIIKYIESV